MIDNILTNTLCKVVGAAALAQDFTFTGKYIISQLLEDIILMYFQWAPSSRAEKFLINKNYI